MAEQNGIDRNVPFIRRTSEGGTTKLLYKPKRGGRQSRGTAVEQDTTAGKFGWCGFEPQWLQYFHNSRWLLAVLFVQVSAIYMQNGIFFAVANSLERQFHFSNTQIGLIYSAGDVGAVILPLVVAHFAQHGHKGRWIAVGLMFYALTNALLTLLQFTSEIGAKDNDALSNSTHSGIDVQYCNTSSAMNAECSNEASLTSTNFGNRAIYGFLVLRALQSVSTGTSPLMVNYIDETVAQKNVSLYITILTGAPQIFLVVGIMLGAAILNIHADFYRIDTSHLDTDNPQWYGAWWIAFLIVSAQIFLSLPPLLGFAKDLPEKRNNRMHDVDQSHAGAERLLIGERPPTSKSAGNGLHNLWRITRSLWRNPVFVLVLLRNSVQFSLLTGITMFFSIYLQHAFRISQTKAPLITAVCWIFPFVFGGFIGSIIIKRRRLHVKQILVMCLISNIIAYSCFMIYLNHCSETNIAGLPGMKQNDPSSFTAELNFQQIDQSSGFLSENCNTGCNCDLRNPYPICWNNITFFSPCHAGCKERVGFEVKDSPELNVSSDECSCISTELNSNRSSAILKLGTNLAPTIAKGKCSPNEECRFRQIIFCLLIAIGSLIGGLGGSPTLQALLHSIPLQHRTVAMGYNSCIIKVFQICGPILAGALFDRSCLIWTESCTKKGSCFHYNINQLSVTIVVVFIVGGIISTLSLFLAILLYRPADQVTANADHN